MASQATALDSFCRLPTPSYEKIYADANRILDDIISQFHSYRKPNQSFSAAEMVQFISHGCEILQNATILLRSKFAQVVNINLPNIKNSLNEKCVNNLVQFLCGSLANSKSPLVMEFMKALALTLAGNGPFLNEESLLLLLAEDGIAWLYMKQSDWVIRGYALQSLGNLCIRSPAKDIIDKEYLRLCYSKLLDALRVLLTEDTGDIDHLKLINVALKALQNVLTSITMNDGIVEPEFAVGLLKIFLVYGTSEYQAVVDKLVKVLPTKRDEDMDPSEKIYPTKRKEKSPMTKKVNTKRSRRKKKKNISVNLEDSFDAVSEENFSSFQSNWRQQSPPVSSSESEYSDSESGQLNQKNSILSKLRQNAATTIQNILRCCDRRTKFSCWLQLVPDCISKDEPSLLSSLAMETSTKIRMSVLLAFMELIDGSKGFLDSAVNISSRLTVLSISSRSFTPFSVKLNHSIHVLHETLLTTLEREHTDVAKDKVIKCLTLLMLNTPYKKIGIDYLPDILKATCHYLLSEDISLCQSTLTCLAASMSVQPDNCDILKLLQLENMPRKGKVDYHPKDQCRKLETSWLVAHCLKRLVEATKDNIRELRLSPEYIQLLTVLLRCHPLLIQREHRNQIIGMLVNVFLFSTDPVVTNHAIKLLEEISKFFVSIHEKTKNDVEGIMFWKKMLSGAIPQYLNVEPEKPIKGQAAICDWMSNMGSHFFAVMKNPEQIFVKTVLIGLSSHDEPLLAAAAVRALGVIIDYPCMKDDVWFVIDVTRSILCQLDNPSVNIRLKAAWSLANLCDFIAKNGFLDKEYPQTMAISLLQYATKAALDNEKVSSNGVRALGNLLKSLPEKLYDHENFQECIGNGVDALIKNIKTSTMKTRWNACYACRYMFENPDCPIGKASWTEDIFNALLDALTECKNFKVRISAAAALCSPATRIRYGDVKAVSNIWHQTLVALEKSEELTDFTEFKHKDTLQDQTTIVLLHLLSVATDEDLILFRQDVHKFEGIFVMHCTRCVNKVEGIDSKIDLQVDNENETESNFEEEKLSQDEKEKIDQLSRYITNAKKNLCTLSNIDKDVSTMDIVKTALYLLT